MRNILGNVRTLLVVLLVPILLGACVELQYKQDANGNLIRYERPLGSDGPYVPVAVIPAGGDTDDMVLLDSNVAEDEIVPAGAVIVGGEYLFYGPNRSIVRRMPRPEHFFHRGGFAGGGGHGGPFMGGGHGGPFVGGGHPGGFVGGGHPGWVGGRGGPAQARAAPNFRPPPTAAPQRRVYQHH